MRNTEELKNFLRLLRQLICLRSFDTWRDAQVQRTLPEELRTLELEELGQLEEFSVMPLKNWAVRALLRSLAMRALKKKHWAYVQASLAWPSWAC